MERVKMQLRNSYNIFQKQYFGPLDTWIFVGAFQCAIQFVGGSFLFWFQAHYVIEAFIQ